MMRHYGMAQRRGGLVAVAIVTGWLVGPLVRPAQADLILFAEDVTSGQHIRVTDNNARDEDPTVGSIAVNSPRVSVLGVSEPPFGPPPPGEATSLVFAASIMNTTGSTDTVRLLLENTGFGGGTDSQLMTSLTGSRVRPGDSATFNSWVNPDDLAPGANFKPPPGSVAAGGPGGVTFPGGSRIGGSNTIAFPDSPAFALWSEAAVTLATGHQISFLLTQDVTVAPVPEPSTWAMLGLGLLGLVGVTRRRPATPAARAFTPL